MRSYALVEQPSSCRDACRQKRIALVCWTRSGDESTTTTTKKTNFGYGDKLVNQTTLVTKEVELTYSVVSKKEECYTSFEFTNIIFPNNTSNFEKGVHVVKI